MTLDCWRTAEAIQGLIAELRRRDLIQGWWSSGSAWGGALRPCESCRSRGKAARARNCRGWEISFARDQALLFRPSTVRGHTVLVQLEAKFDCRKPAGKPLFYLERPAGGCSASLTLYGADYNLLSRQHIDLAQPGQPGPLWHLQLGGVGSSDDAEWRKSVGLVRWPVMPMDVVLAIECIIYLFFNETWLEVSQSAPWREKIRQSEDAVLDHYVAGLQDYWQSRNGDRYASWLGAQCNVVGHLQAN